MSKNVSTMLLLAIIGLAVFLSFYRIGGSDFMMPDEYLYFTGADIGMDLRNTACNIVTIVKSGEIGPAISRVIKEMQFFGRPGYNLLSAIATFIGGRSKTTAFCLSASIGILAILAVYLLTTELFRSRRIALVSSALFAVQGGQVLYSRMAQQTPGAMLFVVLALYFYVRARQDGNKPAVFIMASAVCSGIAFTVHPSAVYILPVFIIMELQRFLSGPSDVMFRAKTVLLAKNLTVFSGAFVASVLVWEVPRILTHIYFIIRGRISVFSDYFTALTPINNIGSYAHGMIVYLSQCRGRKLDLGALGYLPSFLKDSQGALYLALLTVAIAYLIVIVFRRLSDYRPMLIAAWAGCVYIIYSSIHIYNLLPLGFRELRAYVTIFPAICIILALFFEWFFQKKGVLRIIGVFLFLIVFFSSIAHSWEIIASQFSYTTINEYLKKNPQIDKVAMNADLAGMANPKEVVDRLDGFVIADSSWIEHGTMRVDNGGSRLAVMYRDKEEFNNNRIFKSDPGEGRVGVSWPGDIRRLYKEGKVRYLLTSLIDRMWFRGKAIPNDVDPIFSVKSPFVCRARIYDVGAAPELDKFYNTPYFQKIGIYDLRDVFPEEKVEQAR